MGIDLCKIHRSSKQNTPTYLLLAALEGMHVCSRNVVLVSFPLMSLMVVIITCDTKGNTTMKFQIIITYSDEIMIHVQYT